MIALKVLAIMFFTIGFATSFVANLMLLFSNSETIRARANRALVTATTAMVTGIGIWLLFGLDRVP